MYYFFNSINATKKIEVSTMASVGPPLPMPAWLAECIPRNIYCSKYLFLDDGGRSAFHTSVL